MKTNASAASGWMVATFALLALFLVSVSGTFETKPTNESTAFGPDPYIGEISMFGGNFAPRGWALCDGQLLPIAQNTALFSILGTTYGGDGRTTFALPDLRGRVAMHPGQGPGLHPYRLGQKGGLERVPLTPGVPVTSNASGNAQVVNAQLSSSNLQPYQTVNYIIALQGRFPSRD